jgi:hypothetical protein
MAHLLEQRDQLAPREPRASTQHALEVLAVEELHHEPGNREPLVDPRGDDLNHVRAA